jgi:hypothetical protein
MRELHRGCETMQALRVATPQAAAGAHGEGGTGGLGRFSSTAVDRRLEADMPRG